MSESRVTRAHLPCPKCGSSDALSEYSDGHSHCFSCGYHSHGARAPRGVEETAPRMSEGKRIRLVAGEAAPIKSRKLTQETCEKWGYTLGEFKDEPCQIANYRDDKGRVVAQKLRFADKKFVWTGDPSKSGLYGQHLWRDGGRSVIVTEGEIDALTVSQLQDLKWPVVSVPNGAHNAVKDIGKAVEWLEQFESVVFMFDNDEAGREAAHACAAILTPGKAKIATLPLKDANEMLVAGRGKEVISAFWDAKVWRPDEIVAGTDLWEKIIEPSPHATVLYPWKGLNEALLGMRQKEIITLCAGSGIGKSTVCGEIAHHLLSLGETVGYVALEESVKQSALRALSIEMSQPLHLVPQSKWDQEKLRAAYDKTVGSGRWFTYDHFGSLEADNLFNRIRFLVTGCGCKWIVLDHVSIVVSGMGDGDERRLIDNLMTKLRSLVEQLGFGLILVSHLKDTEGKSLEEGGQTHLNLLRGSRSIGQLSDIVLGFERNQQDPENRNLLAVRVLKNRFVGITGVHCQLSYNKDTGRLSEVDDNPFGNESEDETSEGAEDAPAPKKTAKKKSKPDF